MNGTKRLFSRVFEEGDPRSWCIFQRSAKRRRVEPVGPAPPAPDDDDISLASSSTTLSHERPRLRHKRPANSRPVSDKFIKLLKEALDRDYGFRFCAGSADGKQRKYNALLHLKSSRSGTVKRLRGQGIHNARKEAELQKFLGLQPERREGLREANKNVAGAAKKLKRALEKVYQAAQHEIDHPPQVNTDSTQYLPNVFFEDLQLTLDAKNAHQDHATELREARRRLIEAGRRLRSADPNNPDEEAALAEQRRDTAQHYAQVKQDSNLNTADMAEREALLLDLLRPHLSDGPIYVSVRELESKGSVVSRGSKHAPLDEDALADEVPTIPARRDDLINALKATKKLAKLVEDRYDKLAERYDQDLDEYRGKHGPQSRTKFDRKFCRDRAQATRELAVAERQQDRIKHRLKAERLRRIEDMDSDFEWQPKDGHCESEGSRARDKRKVRKKIASGLVEEFLENIPEDDLVDPFETPASEPNYQHDNTWDARPVDVGDIDGVSTAGKGTLEGRRIRKWRSDMEQKRIEEELQEQWRREQGL